MSKDSVAGLSTIGNNLGATAGYPQCKFGDSEHPSGNSGMPPNVNSEIQNNLRATAVYPQLLRPPGSMS